MDGLAGQTQNQISDPAASAEALVDPDQAQPTPGSPIAGELDPEPNLPGEEDQGEPPEGDQNADKSPAKLYAFLPREKGKPKAKKTQAVKSDFSLGRKQEKKKTSLGRKRGRKPGSGDAAWLKQFLPLSSQPGMGWWDVERNGEGWVPKYRWQVGEQTPNLPFPRISREQFLKLQEMSDNERRIELYERIAGHLEELIYDPKRQQRARLVAQRIGIELENDRNAREANYAS